MNSKKYLIISIAISTLLLFGFGITYARFTYNRTGVNNKLILGDIYMHYKETNSINMEGAMPLDISKYSKYVHNSDLRYSEINECISYVASILKEEGITVDTGETYESYCDGTGTLFGYTFQEHLDDNIYLTEDLSYFAENNIIKSYLASDNLSYFEFTIDGKNTYEKENIWYEIVLSHGDNHATRTERIQDNLLKFRLVEVVNGVEAILINNKSYNDLTSKRIWVDTIPANTKTEIEKTYRLYMWISDATIIGNTSDANYDMDTWSNQVYASIKVNVTGDFVEKNIETDANCFTTEVYTAYIHNSNITDAEVSLCTNYLTSIWGAEENNTLDGETYESYCRGTGTIWGFTFQEYLVVDSFSIDALTYFSENNFIIGKESIKITDYDTSCGSDVVIPKTISGYNVTRINEYAFSEKQLISVVIPDTITHIGRDAFYRNPLTNVIILSYDIKIDSMAFETYNTSYPNSIFNFTTFKFNGTCEELNSNSTIFGCDNETPYNIITTDTNACVYNHVICAA